MHQQSVNSEAVPEVHMSAHAVSPLHNTPTSSSCVHRLPFTEVNVAHVLRVGGTLVHVHLALLRVAIGVLLLPAPYKLMGTAEHAHTVMDGEEMKWFV